MASNLVTINRGIGTSERKYAKMLESALFDKGGYVPSPERESHKSS